MLYVRSALCGQSADSAAGEEVASQRNDGNKKEREVFFCFDYGVHRWAHTFRARSLLLCDALCFGPYAYEKEHVRCPLQKVLGDQRKRSIARLGLKQYVGDTTMVRK